LGCIEEKEEEKVNRFVSGIEKEGSKEEDYRIVMPLRLVYILVATFMAANSWNMSFAA